MTTRPLTPEQTDAMRTLSSYKGKGPVDVQTSQYDFDGKGNALYPKTWRPVTIAKAATLRGLAKRGIIRAEFFWRGATVEVL